MLVYCTMSKSSCNSNKQSVNPESGIQNRNYINCDISDVFSRDPLTMKNTFDFEFHPYPGVIKYYFYIFYVYIYVIPECVHCTLYIRINCSNHC